MTHDELVEKVARTMCASVEARTSDVNVVRALGYDSVQAFIDAAWPNYAVEARAAIAVALEQAAKRVWRMRRDGLTQHGDWHGKAGEWMRAALDDAEEAIRALKEGAAK